MQERKFLTQHHFSNKSGTKDVREEGRCCPKWEEAEDSICCRRWRGNQAKTAFFLKT
jgi:hypothetical protein